MRFWKYLDFKDWPPGISDGLVSHCEKCGRLPLFDYQVTDDIWQAVVPKTLNAYVICLPCFDLMAFELGMDVTQHLREVQYAGKRSTVVLIPAISIERKG